jgi:hypothetical protein
MEIEQLAGLGLPGCQGALWLCLGVMSGGWELPPLFLRVTRN